MERFISIGIRAFFPVASQDPAEEDAGGTPAILGFNESIPARSIPPLYFPLAENAFLRFVAGSEFPSQPLSPAPKGSCSGLHFFIRLDLIDGEKENDLSFRSARRVMQVCAGLQCKGRRKAKTRPEGHRWNFCQAIPVGKEKI